MGDLNMRQLQILSLLLVLSNSLVASTRPDSETMHLNFLEDRHRNEYYLNCHNGYMELVSHYANKIRIVTGIHWQRRENSASTWQEYVDTQVGNVVTNSEDFIGNNPEYVITTIFGKVFWRPAWPDSRLRGQYRCLITGTDASGINRTETSESRSVLSEIRAIEAQKAAAELDRTSMTIEPVSDPAFNHYRLVWRAYYRREPTNHPITHVQTGRWQKRYNSTFGWSAYSQESVLDRRPLLNYYFSTIWFYHETIHLAGGQYRYVINGWDARQRRQEEISQVVEITDR